MEKGLKRYSDVHVDLENSRPVYVTPAVSVQNGFLSYTRGTPILDNFNMTVQKGTIYGLLGASGCGKTTMLSCIVGLRQLDSGEIRVFGGRPGTRESGIPGKRLGYMPQDIALYPHFTIKEILQYFGRIYGMSQLEILNRIEFLTNFLNLPDSTRLIAGLSGGQQRRTSLSTALIHDPELLILDEPTVGVDPLLRENIWNHLCQLAGNRTTIIITTHYIEEARQASTVGLMRNGKLLTEKSPDALLREHKATLLEDIVLKLCKKDQSLMDETVGNPKQVDPVTATLSEISFYSKRKMLSVSKNKAQESEYNLHTQNDVVGLKYKRKYSIKPSDGPNALRRRQSIIEIVNDEAKAQRNRIRALIVRNVINFLRNPVFLFGMVLLPAFQTALTALTVGYDVTDMAIGVVNNELPDWQQECLGETRGCKSGNFTGLSCRYLNTIPKETLNLVPYDTKEEAVEQVQLGNLWGVLTIPANYSKHLVDRSAGGNFAENETLEGTIVKMNLDMSHYMAAVLMVRKFYQSFETYLREFGVECGGNPLEYQIPLHYRAPVYGSQEAKYKEYIIPGALTMLLFLMPMCSCGLNYISDKKQGTMERSRSAGVTTFDFMMAFFITEGMVIIVQIVLSTAILTLGFDFVISGSYIWYAALCLLCGLCGQSWGFILGLLCSDETSALLTAFFLYLPMLILTGITWPLESVPQYLRYFSYSLPGTLPTASMRSIVVRGLGIVHPLVWPGFAAIGIWIVVSWILAGIIYRLQK